MALSFETTGLFNNITYSNSMMKFATVLSSSLEMNNIEINQLSLNQYLLECNRCERAIWQNIVIKDFTTTSQYIIFLSGSVINHISNQTITDINAIVYHVYRTNITLIENLHISNATSGINLKLSQLSLLQNSMIRD